VDNLNFDLILPVVSEYEGKIIGYITLQRRCSGWKKHVGDIWLVVSKEFHKKGLESILIKDVIGLAAILGLEKLLVEIPVKVKMMEAMEAFSRCGFARLTVLEDMVKDQRGSYSGVVVMVYDLRRSPS
jgi:GNAT superfamily N-acetyltransferase